MNVFKNLYQDADWKIEKHVPVIEILNPPKKKENIQIMVSIGKAVPHPNTTAHHIRYIELYFQPKDEKFPYQIARVEFNAHGEAVEGADKSSIYTDPLATVNFKTEKEGTIYASSYCNIHGLWESALELRFK
ncbi:MAG: class II SORL domain-containing protein [Parachlamydiales bacterium]|jgi:superoxide reductase